MTTEYFLSGNGIDMPTNMAANDTATLGTVGIQGAPTVQLTYYKVGNQVQAEIAGVSGTSTLLSTVLQLTGVPAGIRPAAARVVRSVFLTSGGLSVVGTARINTNGTIDLFAGPIGTVLSALLTKGVDQQDLNWIV